LLLSTVSQSKVTLDNSELGAPDTTLPQAGGIVRFAAWCLDYFFFGVITSSFAAILLLVANSLSLTNGLSQERIGRISAILTLAIFSYLEGSNQYRTPGKAFCGLRTNWSPSNVPFSILRGFLRLTIKIIFPLGALSIPFNTRRRALHDFIFGSSVVIENPKRLKFGLFIILIPLLVVMAFSLLTFLGEPARDQRFPQQSPPISTPTSLPGTFTTPSDTLTPAPTRMEDTASNEPISGSRAVFFLADSSRSMAFDGKIELERKIILNFAKVMSPKDVIAVIAFNTDPYVVIKPSKISNASSVIEYRLNNLVALGKSDLLPSLKQACRMAFETKPSQLDVVIITDGKIPLPGDELLESVRCITKLGGKITTIGMGDDVDEPFLQMLSDKGGGNYIKATDSAQAIGDLSSALR